MTAAKWIQLLRLLALTEGISFLLLLLIAMPLKHLAGIDIAVKLAGWTHGILFLTVCFLVLAVVMLAGWTLRQAALVIGAALIPCGPFLIDGYMRRQQQQAAD